MLEYLLKYSQICYTLQSEVAGSNPVTSSKETTGNCGLYFLAQKLQKKDQKLHITQFLIFPCYSIINRRGYEYLNVNYINPFGERR